jgi:hypothetical protein
VGYPFFGSEVGKLTIIGRGELVEEAHPAGFKATVGRRPPFDVAGTPTAPNCSRKVVAGSEGGCCRGATGNLG